MGNGSFSEWSPHSAFVQAGLVDGNYANAGCTLIAAGPPRLNNIGGAAAFKGSLSDGKADSIVFPIGVVQNFSLSHNRNFSRIYEIGSERSYFIAGRTMGQIGLGRVYYHGASLLRILYAYYSDLLSPTLVPSMFSNDGSDSMPNKHNVIIPPGYENIYMNLASDLFAQPIGLLVYIRDTNQNTLGAVYAESCYLPNHSWSTDSQGVLHQEQVSLQFERVVPVAITNVSLIDSSANNATGSDLTFDQNA